MREKATGREIPKPQLSQNISPGYDSTAEYMAEDFQRIYLERKTNARTLKNCPLIIVGAGKRNPPPGTSEDQWKTLRSERDSQIQELTSLSSNSKFIPDPQSGHSIHIDHPEIVVQAINDVISAYRNDKKL